MTPEEKEMMWLIVKRDQKQKAIIVAAFERVLCMAGEECTLTYTLLNGPSPLNGRQGTKKS